MEVTRARVCSITVRALRIVKMTIAIFMMLSTAFLAEARHMLVWSQEKMYDRADLVIVARPASTQETAEKWTLQHIAPAVRVIGLSTEFDILLVKKGDGSLKKAVLHHYRIADPKQSKLNGPNLVSFDPKEHTRFLLFLRREADGRYSPVSGQTDPAMDAVVKLGSISE